MALSNLGLITMGGAMLRPGSSLGDGFLGYGQGQVQDARMQAQQAHTGLYQQKFAMERQEFEAKQRAAQQQQESMRAFIGSLSGGAQPKQAEMSPQEMSPQGGLDGALGSGTYGIDPLQAMATKGQQRPVQTDRQGGINMDAMKMLMGMQAGLKREDIEALTNAHTMGMPEVARTIEQTDDMGRPQTGQWDKFGRPVGLPMDKPYQKEFKDTGGAIQPVDPYTSSFVGNSMPKTNSPDSILSSETSRRGQNMTDSRSREFNANTRAATEATKTLAQSGKKWDDLAGLRKEFAGLPEVKNFKEVIPAQQSATDAITRDTAQADINLVYATAKIFDPTSVVREGEYGTVNNSAPPAERFQGMLNHLTGGGKLTANTRQALLREINSRAEAAQGSYQAARQAFTGISSRNGFAPEDVFADLPELAKQKQQPDGIGTGTVSGKINPQDPNNFEGFKIRR